MFSPTKVWRRWHRKINLKQKRLAVASALAASAVPSLVMARGHRVDDVAEIPLVVSDAAESITKTGKAVDMLKALGVYADVAKAAKSKNIRRGKGKMRNRRYVNRKGSPRASGTSPASTTPTSRGSTSSTSPPVATSAASASSPRAPSPSSTSSTPTETPSSPSQRTA